MHDDSTDLGLRAAGPTEGDAAAAVPAGDVPPARDAVPESPPEPGPPRPKFCGTCGAIWQPDWAQCRVCHPNGTAEAAAPGRTLGWDPGATTFYAGGPGTPVRARDAERPRLTSAIVLYFALLAVSIVGIGARVAGAGELSVEFGVSGGMTLIIVAWCAVAARPAVRSLFRPVSARWLVIGAGAALVSFAFAYAIVESLTRGLGLNRINYARPFLSGGYGMGTVVLMVCVQPAVFEELAFRGIVFGALQPTLSVAEAVFVSAGMFMILHLSPAAFPHTFAMGVVAGFMRARTGSLLPGVLMHFIHNLLCVAVDYSPTG